MRPNSLWCEQLAQSQRRHLANKQQLRLMLPYKLLPRRTLYRISRLRRYYTEGLMQQLPKTG